MEWFKTYTNMAKTAEYAMCDDRQQATWFKLICYCVDMENDGVIPDCIGWKDRMCQITIGCNQESIKSECELYWFEDGNLYVFGYPSEEVEKQKTTIQKRKKAGERSGVVRRKKSEKNNTDEHMLNTCSTHVQTGVQTHVEQRRDEKRREDKKEPPYPPGVDVGDVRWNLLLRIWETGKIGPERFPWESWFTVLRGYDAFDCGVHGDALLVELTGMKDKEIGSPHPWFISKMRNVVEGPRRQGGGGGYGEEPSAGGDMAYAPMEGDEEFYRQRKLRFEEMKAAERRELDRLREQDELATEMEEALEEKA